MNDLKKMLNQYNRSAEKIATDSERKITGVLAIRCIKEEIKEIDDLKALFETGKSRDSKKQLSLVVSEKKKILSTKLKDERRQLKKAKSRVFYNGIKLENARIELDKNQ
tara:strand:+ start:95 stop:421 length:327 start_codon:yes stop_codon:yes gene_type:complete